MPRMQPQVVTIDLSNVIDITEYVRGATPGVKLGGFYIAEIPAGASLQIAFQQKNPFNIYLGMSMFFGDCVWVDDGVSILNPVALPGQTMKIVLFPFAEGVGNIGSAS